jgi:MHS family proline/betaine transporter-like MFS transporter
VSTAPAPVTDREKRRVFFAATLGASVEWFDYAVYGVMAPVIAARFFPQQDPVAALLSTFGIFALSFLVRPLGSVFFGSMGDRSGRTRTASVVVLTMTLATVGIGLLPTYDSVGILAPALLLLLRLIQGFSAGGEMGVGAMIHESMGERRRGLIFGLHNVSSYVSSLGALGLAAIVTGWLGEDATAQYGWRLLFLVALPLGLTGLWLRLRILESPVFRQLQANDAIETAPVRTTLRTQRRPLLTYFGLIMVNSVGFYVLNAYLPTYLSETAGVGRVEALWVSALISLTMIAVQPLYGLLSDRIGRRPVILFACVGLFAVSLPMFAVVSTGGFGAIYAGELLFVLVAAPTSALAACLGMELFPPQVRYSGATLGYNLAYAVFGGTAPYVATWLVAATGSRLAPGFYVMAIALVSFAILVTTLPETAPRVLRRRSAEVPA